MKEGKFGPGYVLSSVVGELTHRMQNVGNVGHGARAKAVYEQQKAAALESTPAK